MINKKIGVAGEALTGKEMAEALSAALGEEVLYNKIPAHVYRDFGFPGAVELGNMFQFYDEFEKDVNGIRDVKLSRELNPKLQSFTEWLDKNAKLIPID